MYIINRRYLGFRVWGVPLISQQSRDKDTLSLRVQFLITYRHTFPECYWVLFEGSKLKPLNRWMVSERRDLPKLLSRAWGAYLTSYILLENRFGLALLGFNTYLF